MSSIESIPSIELSIGQPVKVTGGRLNGFTGQLMKACEQFGSIGILFTGVLHEEVIELHFLAPLSVPTPTPTP